MPKKFGSHYENDDDVDTPLQSVIVSSDQPVMSENFMQDMPRTEPPAEHELEAMSADEIALKTLKADLPIFYTARGNVIPRAGKRLVVTNKNFSELSRSIEAVRGRMGMAIMVRTEDWTFVINVRLADLLRIHGQVDTLILAGWMLVPITSFNAHDAHGH